jgi:hypothetical protein
MDSPRPLLEAKLASDPAPLSGLATLVSGLTDLASAATWPALCLGRDRSTWVWRRELNHDLQHLLKDLLGEGSRRARRPGAPGDVLRVAILLDALDATERTEHADRAEELLRERAPFNPVPDPRLGPLETWDAVGPTVLGTDRGLVLNRMLRTTARPPRWAGDLFYSKILRAKMASEFPAHDLNLEILDLRRESPPTLTIGISSAVVSGGAATATEVNPYVGAVVILIGLIGAIQALRTGRADARIREVEVALRESDARIREIDVGIREDDARVRHAEARAIVAREELREHAFRAARGHLDEHPEIVEVVARSALPAALELTESVIGEIHAIETPGTE